MNRIIISIFAMLVLAGCMENKMDTTKELWNNVIGSKSETDEADNMRALRKHIAENDITILVKVKTDEGKLVNINELPAGTKYSSARINFDANDNEYTTPEWTPKNRENIYLLFLE